MTGAGLKIVVKQTIINYFVICANLK